MDYASPASQMLGLLTVIFAGGIIIAAAFFFLREKSVGAWLMFAGSITMLVSQALPQIAYILVSFYSGSTVTASIEPMMYYTIWNWLQPAATLLFASGLLLVALRRRSLVGRIAELETILAARRQKDF